MLVNDLAADAKAYLNPDQLFETKKAAGARQAPQAPPIAILGVTFDNMSLAGTLARIEEMIAAREPCYIVTANVDFLVQARRDAELRRVLLDAHLVLCDGMPLVWTSRLLGNALAERVAGSDLAPQLIRVAAKKNYRLFFLGATPKANEQAIANVRAQFPNANIAGHFSPPFRPLPEMDNEQIRQKILAARPDILFVAFGCPKAEKWMARHHQSLGVPVMIGVGGTIDFLAGWVKRAPPWMQRAGVEWMYRLWQEPRRLFRRYVTDLWHFIPAMAAQCWWMKKSRASRARPGDPFRLTGLQPAWLRIRAPERLDADAAHRGKWIWNGLGSRHCLLDLAGVKFIDSTGVGLLLQLRRKIQATGRRLVLLAPSGAVQQALKRMRVQNLFCLTADAIEARGLIEEQTQTNGHDTVLRDTALSPKLEGLLAGASP
jgi:N-acetylglucosaminyldiphosphoundecaprenol N-acetyl-beta-D-mannosaminyltransferase